MSDTQNTSSAQSNQDQFNSLMDQLIDQADRLKKNAVTAEGAATGAISQGVLQAQKDAEQDYNDLVESKEQIRDTDGEGWQGFKDNFHNFFAKQRVKFNKHDIENDVEKAAKEAQRAEDKAMDSLNYALQTMKAAQVAVLDAAQARAYQTELKSNLDGVS